MTTMERAISKIFGNPIFSQLSPINELQDGKRAVMFFVIPPGKRRASLENLSIGRMFQAAKQHLLPVQWITDVESIDTVLENDGNIFVFDSFGKSEGFQIWQDKTKTVPFRVELLGPPVLQTVFTSQDIFEFQTNGEPTLTLAMRGMVITFSGFNKEIDKKNELEQLVRWMNGSLSAGLTKTVTHVVTAIAGTPKCIEAHRGGLPVMTEEWIRELWKDNQSSAVDGSDRRYVKFRCPVFHNLKISLSGIPKFEKERIKNGIERLGGSVTADIFKGQLDVLVVAKPEGNKHKYASKWKVNCVTPEWVEHSTEKGYVVPYEPFQPPPPPTLSPPPPPPPSSSPSPSPPTQGPPPPPTNRQTTHNDSVQNREENGTSKLLSGVSFKVVTPSKDEVQFLEELITKNGGILEKQNPEIMILPPLCEASDLEGTSRFYTKYWLMECLLLNSFEIEAAGHHNPRAAFDGMEKILEGIVVTISKYPTSERECLRELVTALGGRYQEVFTSRDSETRARNTHLICNEPGGAKPKAAKRWGVPVVLAEWVYDSFDEKKYVDEHRYGPSDLNRTDDQSVYLPTPPGALAKKGTSELAPIRRQRETTPEPGPSRGRDNAISAPSFVPPAAAAVAPTSANGHVSPAGPLHFEDSDPVLAELQRKVAEAEANFPYSKESFENFLQDLDARGVNYRDAPSFTSEEERRLLDENPASPLLLGLPRKESRALKEHFEIAMARSPRPPHFNLRRRSSRISMSAWTEWFKDIERRKAELEPSLTPSPRPDDVDTSTEDEDLGASALEANGNPGQATVLGIRRLASTPPSDGSPDDESK